LKFLRLEGFNLVPVVLSAKSNVDHHNGKRMFAKDNSQRRRTVPQVIQKGIRGVRPIQAQFYPTVLPGYALWYLEQSILMLPAISGGKSDIGNSYCLDPVTGIRAFNFYGALQTTQDGMFGLML
jgi:hypothetical protein